MKSPYKIHTIVLLMALFFFGNSFLMHNEPELIEEGKCFGAICIDKTTPKEIIKSFGDGNIKEYKKRHETKKGYSTRKWMELKYDHLGLKFTAGTKSTSVYDIEISLPYKAITKKGIRLGTSVAEDVLRLYGSPKERKQDSKTFSETNGHEFFICCDSVYRYPNLGIDFVVNCDTLFTISDDIKTDKKKLQTCNVIKKVRIYNPY